MHGVEACGMGLVRSVVGARVRRNACEAGVGKDIAKDSVSRRVECRRESCLAKLFLCTNIDLQNVLACAGCRRWIVVGQARVCVHARRGAGWCANRATGCAVC